MKIKYYVLLSAVFTALGISILSAQQNKQIGTVGNKPINQQFITNITTVYPHLNNSADTSIIRGYVNKYYAKQIVMGDSVKKMAAYDSLKPIIEDLRRLIEAKVLAQYFQDKIIEKAIIPSDKEISDYYEKNKNQFKTIPVYSYFQAYTASDDKDVIADIKKSTLELYHQPPEKYGTSKKTGDKYTLNFESKLKIYPNDNLYETLKKGKIGEIVGPLDIKGRNEKLYLLVTYIEPEVIKPLNDVRQECINNLRIIKHNAIDAELDNKTNKQYPIKLN